MITPASRAVASLLAALSCAAHAAEQHEFASAPYVPTPPVVVSAMLRLAEVGPRDFVVDLGSGDGRILIAAAKQFGARGFGVEIDGALVQEARREARRQGVADRVRFVEEDLFVTPIARASVVTLYLYPQLLAQLRPRFLDQLQPGTRIVSHDFGIDGWRPDARMTVPVPDKPYGEPSSEVYFWVVPANAAGSWRWPAADGGQAGESEVVLSQAFQMLEGAGTSGGAHVRVDEGRMRGDEIRFILSATAGGPAARAEYRGRVSGDTIAGTVRDGSGERDWRATRVKRGRIGMR